MFMIDIDNFNALINSSLIKNWLFKIEKICPLQQLQFSFQNLNQEMAGVFFTKLYQF